MKLLKNYDVTIQYHPVKANVVADTVSQKAANMSLAYLSVSKWLLAKEIQTLEYKFKQYGILERGGLLDSNEVRDTLLADIKAKEFEDEYWRSLKRRLRFVRHKRPFMMRMVYSIWKGQYVFLE